MKKRMLVLSNKDNVGVLLEDAHKGDTAVCKETEITCLDDIPYCHKVALVDIPRHEYFIKYGDIIGYAMKDVKKGEWVHTHNLDDVKAREGML